MSNLVLCVTGASGALTAKVLMEQSPWPVTLVVSEWGKDVYERECGKIDELVKKAADFFRNSDLAAPISSGSVDTVGMVIAPCSSNTLGLIASGISDSLITRAAHCHLKERRNLIICLRESPLTLIDIENAAKLVKAGATVMPISPPFYMMKGKKPAQISLLELMELFVERVFSILGHKPVRTWEGVQHKKIAIL